MPYITYPVYYSILIHTLSHSSFHCVVAYYIYSTDSSRAPYSTATFHISLTSMRKIIGYWSFIYKIILHTTFHIDSDDTIHYVINFAKFLNSFTSTPWQLPYNLVLHIKVHPCQFIFASFPLLSIHYIFPSWPKHFPVPL